MPTSTRSPSSTCASFCFLLLKLLTTAAIVAAQSIAPANSSTPSLTTVNADLIGLRVTREGPVPQPVVLATPTLLPLVDPAEAAVKLPDPGRTGSLFNATSDNVGNITSMSIAWISCDPSDYTADTSAINVLEKVVQNNAAAALLYSRSADFCNFTAGPKISSNFTFLYSMTSARGSAEFFNMLNINAEGAPMHVTINLIRRLAAADDNRNNNGTGPGQDNGNSPPGGPSPSTAVAMIILYSITGVITALFLIIIITGAIRAHRHPERYGPRAVLGRTRQSRAKGLARAMLDSIPIVKFGEEEDDASKHEGDVEMGAAAAAGEGSGQQQRQSGDSSEASTKAEGAGDGAEERHSADAAAGSHSAPRESEDGIGRGIATPPRPANQLDQSLGCSICTEDFERGEDVRLLPCNHKFHPACIDPWLLNVSGTCPLCRIDLRPPTSGDPDDANNDSESVAERSGSADAGAGNNNNNNLQPGDPRRQSRRLSSFFHNPLNRQRMQEASPEERIEALRQYNAQQQERAGRPDDSRRRRRLSAHLSGIFTGGNRRRDEEGSNEGGSRSGSPGAEIPVEPPALSPLSFEQRHHHHESIVSPISPVPESEAIDHAPAILVHPPAESEKGKAREDTAA